MQVSYSATSSQKPNDRRDVSHAVQTHIGVAGAGVMGRAIAAELAARGAEVILYDSDKHVLERCGDEIQALIRMRALMQGVPQDQYAALRIRVSGDIGDLSASSLVIENIVERAEEKRSLYRELDAACRPATIFVVNSSTFKISEVASWTGRAERVIGIHFMNPVALIAYAEVVAGENTSTTTRNEAERLLAFMGKRALHVGDMPGYVSNRIYMLTVNEAILCLQDCVADVSTIDQLFFHCFGWKAGPLATADLIGLDTVLFSLDALFKAFGQEKFKPAQLLVEMVDKGLFGQKSGKGFYEYD
ncbi:3-hydroxyacyl-CoA dehydrogenase family protein [Dyella sp. GSA-30]|uniref:3-hydroxyacyl-CoA dehydrogenase family protein n=1 Tax=Dyella sp. GSA-30 TaxID=2994496 RepID=UPI002492B668|nr:3-hydroxyacyl-CoA dehydrogenase family protein [Dyella sp. GSA-30]BDU21619.1 3-hydroxybutyryl-CoA dehydrogenase [Dyella sp. GSA-30]